MIQEIDFVTIESETWNHSPPDAVLELSINKSVDLSFFHSSRFLNLSTSLLAAVVYLYHLYIQLSSDFTVNINYVIACHSNPTLINGMGTPRSPVLVTVSFITKKV